MLSYSVNYIYISIMIVEGMKDKLTIMIADDHPLIRKGIAALFQDYPHFELSGEASNGKELLDKMKSRQPEIVLLDLEMPIMNGDETFVVIKSKFPNTKVIIVSVHFDHALISHFIAKGVNAYLPKDADPGILIDTIHSVTQEECYVDLLPGGPAQKKGSADCRKFLLTKKEMEVLKLICQGMNNSEIADKLELSVNTVDYHRKNIYEKTQVNKAALLTLFAVRNGIISANQPLIGT